MVQYTNNSRRNLARSLRNGGYSYSEIQKFVSVPKATLSYWFRDLELSESQIKRLQEKRSEASRRGTLERSKAVSEAIEKIKASSSVQIGKISRRELWLMGVVLYWRNRNFGDVKKGVHFSTTDPELARLFLKWLKDIGQLTKKEIALDLFVKGNSKKAITFWSTVTGFEESCFGRVYRYRKSTTLATENGMIRMRVKASSMLARQLAGWIEGIKKQL
ncbi:MAG: hypothetical protein UX31_C0001G0011 [Candidatus Nomurabacteria bacterium GW2011_GWA1_46_11]|uniref:Uncharacterized protein n=2 Tax=Parcubacteria group TaxID=1794811 RepID=A0A1F8EYU3_9BACT|nr:MAG: hypothetical protein UX31_C0001G0011 [Candidatus Nomurabacteria bacterium GW2011_GWA1_46_11]OGN06044.1 MAG: hypothetical protein A2669_00745 [Candidatus Yanofskybacteria bacterium RIFCSPHIGHO2_01_FULL_48_25b]